MEEKTTAITGAPWIESVVGLTKRARGISVRRRTEGNERVFIR